MYIRKGLLFIVLIIFLCFGCVSAHDTNQTDAYSADNITDTEILEDTPVYEEYNISSDINLTINNQESIKIDVDKYESDNDTSNVHNLSGITVYIDNKAVFDRSFNSNSHYKFSIPVDEMDLAAGKHNICLELKIRDTFKKSTPKITLKNNMLYISFSESAILDQKKNYIYRYNSTFTVIEKPEPIITIINVTGEEIIISYSDNIPFIVNGSDSGEINFFINNKIFDTYSYDKTPFDCEISTLNNTYSSYDIKYLDIGKYNVTFEFIIQNSSVSYLPAFKKINSSYVFEFKKAETTVHPQDYVYRFNVVLNIIDNIDETIKINSDVNSINITYKDSIAIFSSEFAKLKIYVDDELIFDDYALSFNYIESYLQQDYIPVGSHNIRFEFKHENTHTKYDVELVDFQSTLYFDFTEAEETDYLHDYTYVADLTLNVMEKPDYIEIPIKDISEELSNVTINRTDAIKVFFENPEGALMKVFVDNKEIYRTTLYEYDWDESIDTFISSRTVNLKNPVDIPAGRHDLRFEFYFMNDYRYMVSEVNVVNSTPTFGFYQASSLLSPVNYMLTYNTTLNVVEINKTIDILKVKNETYNIGSSVLLNFSNGGGEIGVILSNENGVVYKYDEVVSLEDNSTAELVLMLVDGKGGYNFINAGLYNLTIINFNDGTYDTALVRIFKSDMIVEEMEGYEKFKAIFTVYITEMPENAEYKITLDGKTKKIKGYEDSGVDIVFDNLLPGDYTVRFHSPGDINYNPIDYTKKITIEKVESSLYATDEINDNSIVFKIHPGIGGTKNNLTIKFGDVIKKIPIMQGTDYMTLTFDNLNPGKYEAVIEIAENEKYLSSKLFIPFEITYVPPAPPKEDTSENSTSQTTQNATAPISTFNKNSNSTSPLNTGGNSKSAAPNNHQGTIKKSEVSDYKEYMGNAGQDTVENSLESSAKSYEISKSPSKTVNNNSYVLLILAILILALILIRPDRRHDEY